MEKFRNNEKIEVRKRIDEEREDYLDSLKDKESRWKMGGVEVKTPWPGKCEERMVYTKEEDGEEVQIYFWYDKDKKEGVLNLYDGTCNSEWPAMQMQGSFQECYDWIMENDFNESDK